MSTSLIASILSSIVKRVHLSASSKCATSPVSLLIGVACAANLASHNAWAYATGIVPEPLIYRLHLLRASTRCCMISRGIGLDSTIFSTSCFKVCVFGYVVFIWEFKIIISRYLTSIVTSACECFRLRTYGFGSLSIVYRNTCMVEPLDSARQCSGGEWLTPLVGGTGRSIPTNAEPTANKPELVPDF